MNHPDADELAAEASGLATAEEHEKVLRHLPGCTVCLEEFARRCSESAAIEEALRSRPARPGWRSAAVAAIFLGALGLALLRPSPPPAADPPAGGASVRDSRMHLSLEDGDAVLTMSEGTLGRIDGILRYQGRLELTPKGGGKSIHASYAEVDTRKKTLILDLAWPPAFDRTGLPDRPSFRIVGKNGTSWTRNGVDRTEITEGSVTLTFGVRPASGEEVAIHGEAAAILLEKGPDGEKVSYVGRVRLRLPNGAHLRAETADWTPLRGPFPSVLLRLE